MRTTLATLFAFSLRPPPSALLPQERHRCEPFHSRAAQELEQQRLDLVVAVVRKHDVIAVLAREHRIARRARRCLDAVSPPHSDLHALEWDAARAAETPAERFPARGRGDSTGD